jgi:hypothetical protein
MQRGLIFSLFFRIGKAVLGTVLFEIQKFPTFGDNRYMKVVSLSELPTSLLYPQVIFLVPISFRD